MKLKTITLFFWCALIASAAVAEEKKETHIEIKMDDGEHGTFEWSSSDDDFSDLEVGESKTITGDDGREVTVTRTEKGLEMDVEGKKIELMHLDGDHDVVIDVDATHDAHGDAKVIIKETKDVKIIKTDGKDGVTIISTSELDDETRAKLEVVLKEAGKDGSIMILDGSELHDAQAHGEHEVRIIKQKKVEKKED